MKLLGVRMLDFVKRLFGRKEAPISYSGGDGSSEEAAIVIEVDDPTRGIKAEYDYIQQRHGTRGVAWKRDMQIKTKSKGQSFDVISIVLADGTEKVFWFNISRFVGN